MSRLKVQAFSLSLDGYGAGPRQSVDNPLGVGGESLHQWMGVRKGPDAEFVRRSYANIGAWIMGRNMFAPSRGDWQDGEWKGWWGPNPPFHRPVFVLTHYPRPSITMEGGTVFHFVTGGIHEALDRARAAAQGQDVRLGGGVATVRAYLQAGLVDEMHLVFPPALLGSGEALLPDIDLVRQRFWRIEHVATPHALHVVLAKD